MQRALCIPWLLGASLVGQPSLETDPASAWLLSDVDVVQAAATSFVSQAACEITNEQLEPSLDSLAVALIPGRWADADGQPQATWSARRVRGASGEPRLRVQRLPRSSRGPPVTA